MSFENGSIKAVAHSHAAYQLKILPRDNGIDGSRANNNSNSPCSRPKFAVQFYTSDTKTTRRKIVSIVGTPPGDKWWREKDKSFSLSLDKK